MLFLFVYPLDEISKPSCRFEIRSNLSEECKMKLPKIENADYSKYKDNKLYRIIYTVLWMSTYTNWRDIWNWSHQGVDIATSFWTPVYSIWEWIVEKAWELEWWWKTIVIKHKYNNWYIWSNYAHLSKINVKVWEKVSTGQKIWEVWRSWFAFWNHLHFQIDLNWPWPTYHKCKERKWILDTVNLWLCKEDVLKNTIDPIKFLENKEISNKYFEIKPREITPLNKILEDENNEFLSNYQLYIKPNFIFNTLEQNKVWKIIIWFKNKNNKKFIWYLPTELKIESKLEINPSWIIDLTTEREIIIKWSKPWKYIIDFKLWNKTIKSTSIYISPIKEQNIQKAKLITSKLFIGDENIWIFSFYNNNIRINKIKWIYNIKIHNWKICLINLKKQCITDFSDNISFSNNNLIKWLLLIKILPSNENFKISIDKIFEKNLYANIPIDFNDVKNEYKDAVLWSIKKWYILNFSNWYFAPNYFLTNKDIAKAFNLPYNEIRNITRYEFLYFISNKFNIKAKTKDKFFNDCNDEICNIFKEYNIKLDNFEKYFQPNEFLTREQAAYILYKILR